MKLPRMVLMVALFAVLFCLLTGGLSAVQSRMNAIRIEERLTDTEPLLNAPPVVAFTTVALGGFRGLVADWLWLRAGRLQQEGNYFEMVQLASWIVKLQPRFTAATAYLAWNMSYNISVTFNSFEDRWRWVKAGIELIRDEALNYNPGDPELFRQLGWIYQHKLGKDLDDANRFYKTEFAKEMIKVFGDYSNEWERIGLAPLAPEKIRAVIGEDCPLWEVLRTRDLNFEDFEKEFREAGQLPDYAADAVADPQQRGTLELSLRHRWLLYRCRIEPDVALEVNALYGDLDWRLPQAHAIYWAVRGKKEWDSDEDAFKRLQCDRMIFQALNHAFQGGRLIYLEDIEHLEMTPNLNVVDATIQAYADAEELHGTKTVGPAFENFMVDAVVTLYKFGKTKEAAGLFKQGKEKFGHPFEGQYDRFALKQLEEDMTVATYDQAQGTVQGLLIQSCYRLLLGEDEEAFTYERLARFSHNRYMKFIEGTEDRRRLPPYPQMKRTAIGLAGEMFSPEMKARLENALKDHDGFVFPEPEDIVAPDDATEQN